MADISGLTAAFPQCVKDFNRRDYRAAYKNYCADCKEFFTGIGDIDEAVSSVLAFADKKLEKRFGRSTMLLDLRTFLCVYLCPAALTFGSEDSRAFAEKLVSQWNARHADCRFELGTFEDIASGFSKKPFGF